MARLNREVFRPEGSDLVYFDMDHPVLNLDGAFQYAGLGFASLRRCP